MVPQTQQTIALTHSELSPAATLSPAQQRWLGQVCPTSWPLSVHRRSVALVSSRLSKRLDLETAWLDRLRQQLASLQSQSESVQVLVGEQAAGAELVEAGCRLYGIPIVRLQPDPSAPADSDTTPLVDRALFALADEVRVLSCRSRGNIARLIERHLLDPDRRAVPIYVPAELLHCLPAEQRQLVQRQPALVAGLTPNSRLSPDGQATLATWRRHSASPQAAAIVAPPHDHPLVSPAEWLCHWTRPSTGPWPGESRQQYFEALLQTDSDRSALSSLRRIVSEQCLRGSRLAIRGGHLVVAFTAVPLTEFRHRRVFRGHRQRYDFEPWGLAIRRSALQGLRPVIYGCSEDWKSLPVADRPWFQKATLDGITDTVAEQEWRVAGDLDLQPLSASDVVVFVDNPDDAVNLQPDCRWPVMVLPEKVNAICQAE